MSKSRSKLNIALPTIPENRPLHTVGSADSTSLRSSLVATSSAPAPQNNNDDDEDFDAAAFESPVFQLPAALDPFKVPKAGRLETTPQYKGKSFNLFDKERLLAIGRGHKITASQSDADGFESCDESDSSQSTKSVVKKSPR